MRVRFGQLDDDNHKAQEHPEVVMVGFCGEGRPSHIIALQDNGYIVGSVLLIILIVACTFGYMQT